MVRISVLLGGNSSERKVSLITGAEVAKQLRLNGYEVSELDPADFSDGHNLISAIKELKSDLVFIGLHGGDGENGVIQALLHSCDIPYTGSDFKSSAIAMDKLLSKYVARQVDVPVPAFFVAENKKISDYTFSTLNTILNSGSSSKAIVVKPVDSGSSVGVHIVDNEDDFKAALIDAFNHSDRVMIEQYIQGRELTVTVLDGIALPVVEIQPHKGFYDYPNKYSQGNTTYIAPAELNDNEAVTIQDYAIRIWRTMGCSGYGRIDFRYDNSVFYFLEVNTLPGMTPLSLTPMAAKAHGISFADLLDRIIAAVPGLKFKFTVNQ